MPVSIVNSRDSDVSNAMDGSALDDADGPAIGSGSAPIPISSSSGAGGKAKKRGVDYKCESCAKVRVPDHPHSATLELEYRSTATQTA